MTTSSRVGRGWRIGRPVWQSVGGRVVALGLGVGLATAAAGCDAGTSAPPAPAWEVANPLVPLPSAPLGISIDLSALPNPPTPARVRLGRWLFYDARLSRDGTVACATCHRPANGFSEPTATSTGISGQVGGRKAPSVLNLATTLYPHFFWDGRASSLEDQALGPIQNPIEMGNTHEGMVRSVAAIPGYGVYFNEAFGTPEVTKDRIAQAIADYEKTRMSGNSRWDQWRATKNGTAVSEQVKRGHDLFFGKAGCNQCHLGGNFTDNRFHNVGIGWDPKTKSFSDPGRFGVTKLAEDLGAFKTPGLRDVSRRAPYMHDGSVATLREAVDLYSKGGHANPHLDPKITKLNLASDEIDALVAMLEALDGEGYQDAAPAAFPR